MLKLSGMSDLERNLPPVRLEGRLYAPWSADVDGQTVVVLIDIEGLAGNRDAHSLLLKQQRSFLS